MVLTEQMPCKGERVNDNIMNYTTILFDADDTLLDFKKAEKTALTQVLTEYGMPATERVTARYSEINAGLWREFEKGSITKEDIKRERYSRLFKEFGFNCPVSVTEVNNRYLELLGEGAYLKEGAFELCKTLKESGFDLYIITNGIAGTQKRRMEKCGLERFFNDIFVSETIGFQKPFREFFDFAAQAVPEKDKSKILVVGDSLGSDIKGAVDYGLDCVWYNPSHNICNMDLKINYEIEKLNELKDILEINI